jgi:hypothetical protein
VPIGVGSDVGVELGIVVDVGVAVNVGRAVGVDISTATCTLDVVCPGHSTAINPKPVTAKPNSNKNPQAILLRGND